MAAEPEVRQPDVLAEEEEPRYLRRQKPVEIRRRKLGPRNWRYYARRVAWVAAGMAVLGTIALTVHFALFSPALQLTSLDQIEVRGNQFVPRSAVVDKFTADEGRSVLRIPLDARRAALEQIPWVERATVQRLLPNGVRVVIVERTPVAFLRSGGELSLLDAQGVLLERPLEGEFAFPVVAGMSELTPAPERRMRMAMFIQFVQSVEAAWPGGMATVSEVDLGDPVDLRAVIAGLPELSSGRAAAQESVLVHFGEGDFAAKYKVFAENIAEWRVSVGRVDSVDLRFARQVVVNPESPAQDARLAPRPGTPVAPKRQL